MDRVKKQKIRTLLFLLLLVLVFSCREDSTSDDEGSHHEVASEDTGIDHLVFFSLKDSMNDLEIQKFKELLKTLKTIDGVDEVELGTPQDVGDPRALKYNLLMEIEFETITQLHSYAEHPYHLKVRDSLKGFLASPPATLDLISD